MNVHFNKSTLAVVLCLGISISSFTHAATYGGGKGTIADPYHICTPQQMNTIGAHSEDWDKHFILMDDIDMSAYTGTQYNIIGSAITNFTGTFDGNRHVIHNLTYTRTSAYDYFGLFGYIKNASIQNLGLENVNLIGRNFVGALVGGNYSGTITNCYATGSVNGRFSVGGLVGLNEYGIITSSYATGLAICSYAYVGGLVGINSGDITSCYTTGSVSISDSEANLAGGLIGLNSGTIMFCHAIGSVNGKGDIVGGLVGHNFDGRIVSCYAIEAVSGKSDVGGLLGMNLNGMVMFCYATRPVNGLSSVGGLVGNNSGTIAACYATGLTRGQSNVGGLVGSNWESVTLSFWDTQTSGQTISSGGTGKTTVEMKTLSTFTEAGWDFTGESNNGIDDPWRMCADGIDYPKLTMQLIDQSDFLCPNGINIEDLVFYATQWQRNDCTLANQYCRGADLDYSSNVDLADWAIFACHWLQEEYIAPLLPSPVAWWKMNEEAGSTVIDSINGHHGQTVNISGNPWVAGYRNNALKLDGTKNYVEATDFTGITGTTSRTCVAWIKANSNGKEQVILSWGNEDNGQKWIFRLQSTGQLALGVRGGYIYGNIAVADGQWHHIVAVLTDDGSPSVNEIKLYVDGIAQTVTYNTTQAINTAEGQNVQIGSIHINTAQVSFFNGLIDEVRIYDVALTEEDIYRLTIE